MDLTSKSAVVEALRRVGELLEADGHAYAIVILGGAALNLLGIVDRPTTDVDILAFAQPALRGPRVLREPPEPMPAPLVTAAGIVARDMGLDPDWLNTGPLLALSPTGGELDDAAAWVGTQDASPDFATVLDKVVRHVRTDLGLND